VGKDGQVSVVLPPFTSLLPPCLSTFLPLPLPQLNFVYPSVYRFTFYHSYWCRWISSLVLFSIHSARSKTKKSWKRKRKRMTESKYCLPIAVYLYPSRTARSHTQALCMNVLIFYISVVLSLTNSLYNLFSFRNRAKYMSEQLEKQKKWKEEHVSCGLYSSVSWLQSLSTPPFVCQTLTHEHSILVPIFL